VFFCGLVSELFARFGVEEKKFGRKKKSSRRKNEKKKKQEKTK
jgi:hypothetical protein